MVPRWRSSADAVQTGELSQVGKRGIDTLGTPKGGIDDPETRRLATEAVNALAADWQRTRAFGFAADLVSAASVVSASETLQPSVRDAAEFLLRHRRTGPLLRQIATRLVAPVEGTTMPPPSRGGIITGEHETLGADVPNPALAPFRLAVRWHRRAVATYPYDPLCWVDLSRAYLITGNSSAAERAIKIALGLAPDHRFVLRAATRLFIHLGKRSPRLRVEAWSRLRRSSAAKIDPWLAAAEIATAMVLNETPRLVKPARAMLASGHFSPFELSELAGALASLEIDAGAIRKGRKLFDQALREPTENTVAQAAWTAQHLASDLHGRIGSLSVASHEARAWDDYRAENWRGVVNATTSWGADEPFSSRPLRMGAFVAAGPLGDFSLSAEIGSAAIITNPEDAHIRNNLAFAYASLGKVSSATEVLSRVRLPSLDVEHRIACVATWGLIAFRRGALEEGRQLYEAAIDAARRMRRQELEALAIMYLAREELLAGQPNATDVLETAGRLLKRTPKPYLRAVMSQVEAIKAKHNPTERPDAAS